MKTDMKNIKNLLFDLGGVIMDIRKENCIAAFEKLGLENAASYFGDFAQQGPFMMVERGDMTPDEFHAALRPALPPGVSDAEIDSAFCKFLIGIPPRRLDALECLGERFNVCLLSNTNPIMWDSTIREEFEKCGRRREDYFPGGMVTSFEANALKPERKIFQYTVEKLGIDPRETIFLDDSQANLDAASELGFRTMLVAPSSEFVDLIPDA